MNEPTQLEAEAALEYRALYYLWEQQHWETGEIDFSEDRKQWSGLSPELRESVLGTVAFGHVAAEQAAQSLIPFVDAAPSEEQAVFLTTQLVDTARHVVFYDRFGSDVVNDGGTDMHSRTDAQIDRLTSESRRLLLELLPAAAERIKNEPGNVGALADGVSLYRDVIRETMELADHSLAELRGPDLLPGLRQGLAAIARDQARHLAFAERFLKEVELL